MIPQEHPEAIWPAEQAPFHIEETPSWRARSRFFRILGVVVPLVASFVFFFLGLLSGIIPLLVGIVSAGLFRSWWAVLIVPVVFSIGFFLSSIILGGGIVLPNPADPGFLEGPAILVGLGLVPIAIGAAIGTPIGKKIEQRLLVVAVAADHGRVLI